MAVPFLYGPREHHGVKSAADYRKAQAAFLAKKQRRGQRFEVHVERTQAVAFVSAGSWVIQCECGAGNATDPAWGVACCFACGAIHESVIFPDDVKAIEAALLDRAQPMTRHWLPGESAADLRAETIARGRGRR